jgi:hypothetical protein
MANSCWLIIIRNVVKEINILFEISFKSAIKSPIATISQLLVNRNDICGCYSQANIA